MGAKRLAKETSKERASFGVLPGYALSKIFRFKRKTQIEPADFDLK
jgi:hypothetical protein